MAESRQRDTRLDELIGRLRSMYVVETFEGVADLQHKVLRTVQVWSARQEAERSAAGDVLTLQIVQASPSELVFLAVTEDGRLEDRMRIDRTMIEAPLLSLFDQYSTSIKEHSRRALYGLLLPPAIALRIEESRDVRLQLDAETERFPWEMLQPPGERLPLSLSRRITRIYATEPTVTRRKSAVPRTALVIGNPLTTRARFRNLPGAAHEAEQVANLLTSAGFEVELLTGSSSVRLIASMAEREWGILHLAGHGVTYQKRENGEIATGVVLGDDVFFGAHEFSRLRRLPHLIFLSIALPAPRGEADVMRPLPSTQLTASLIEGGVRAVVAPINMVDDSSAVNFANAFYTNLLMGLSFAEAVVFARRDTYDREPRGGSSEAYTAHGDPSLRLVEAPPAVQATKSTRKTSRRKTSKREASKPKPSSPKTSTRARKTRAVRKFVGRKSSARKAGVKKR